MSLLQRNPTDAPVLPLARYAKGYARLIARDYDAALAELRTAAASDPLVGSDSAIRSDHASGDHALREGRWAEARSLFDQTNTLPDSSEVHRILADLFGKL